LLRARRILEAEDTLADGHDVPVLETIRHTRLGNRFIDNQRVRAAQVNDHDIFAVTTEDRVVARHQGVDQHEIIVLASADRELQFGQLIAPPDLRAPLRDQEGRHGILLRGRWRALRGTTAPRVR